MTEYTNPNPGKKYPYEMTDETVSSGENLNPATYDPEREWGKNSTNYDGFHLDFPGQVPPAYFPGYPGRPYI